MILPWFHIWRRQRKLYNGDESLEQSLWNLTSSEMPQSVLWHISWQRVATDGDQSVTGRRNCVRGARSQVSSSLFVYMLITCCFLGVLQLRWPELGAGTPQRGGGWSRGWAELLRCQWSVHLRPGVITEYIPAAAVKILCFICWQSWAVVTGANDNN